VEQIDPDLVLMDVQMPVMDGLEASRAIRKLHSEKFKTLPIVALTAGVSKEERSNCKMAGMDDFISKPIDKTQLFQVLKKYLYPKEKVAEKTTNSGAELVHFNREKLLHKMGDNREVVMEILAIARDEFPTYITGLRIAIEKNDQVEIKRASHTLKGSALNLEFIRLGELAHEIERSNNEQKEVRKLYKELVDEWKALEDEFRH
jgi:HPt (histidine-containing phosphotransfer) domain-containing protein